jgi:serine/threonine protein kinase
VLINDMHRACISDFGLTIISSVTAAVTTVGDTNARWLALELLNGTERHPNRQSDVFAFGRVCLEVYCSGHLYDVVSHVDDITQAYTLKPPFHHIAKEAVVIATVLQGQSLKRPPLTEYPGPLLPDHIWALMEACWDAPSLRPSASEITAMFDQISRPGGKHAFLSPHNTTLPAYRNPDGGDDSLIPPGFYHSRWRTTP